MHKIQQLSVGPNGGSELAFRCLLQHLGTNWAEHINILLSTCDHTALNPDKINVVWQQLSHDQENVKLMSDPDFVNKVDYFVFVSHWNYEKFRTIHKIPEHKSIVIKNATNTFPVLTKQKTDKLKLIYTSTPWRGLHVLLNTIELLDRSDIEVDIYSSSIIYGSKFSKVVNTNYDFLYDKAKSMTNVNYMGYASNDGVRKAVQSAHIFSYPNTFEETSCMSAIEAASAGCQIVTTDNGALYETCADWATYVPYNSDHKKLAYTYAEELNKCIDNYWTDEVQNRLKSQVEYYNRFYSWDVRKIEWRNFFDRIIAEKA